MFEDNFFSKFASFCLKVYLAWSKTWNENLIFMLPRVWIGALIIGAISVVYWLFVFFVTAFGTLPFLNSATFKELYNQNLTLALLILALSTAAFYGIGLKIWFHFKISVLKNDIGSFQLQNFKDYLDFQHNDPAIKTEPLLLVTESRPLPQIVSFSVILLLLTYLSFILYLVRLSEISAS